MRSKLLYGFLAVAILLYLVSVFVFNADSTGLARYHISDAQLKLLSLIFLIPTFLTWFVAIYSIDKIADYSASIQETKDGKGMRLLTWGLMVLGLGVIVNGLLSRILTYAVAQHIIDQSTSTIITAKFGTTYLFTCFLLFFFGSRRLLDSLHKKAELPPSHYVGVTLTIVAICIPYVTAVLSNPSRTVATGAARFATYALPDWLILTTVVAPYLVAWTLGFYAVLFLREYQMQVGGVLYKRALSKLYKGFAIIVLLTIVLQFISAVSPVILGWLLTPILLLLIVLLAVIIIGYIYVALGAKGLTKLEEVT